MDSQEKPKACTEAPSIKDFQTAVANHTLQELLMPHARCHMRKTSDGNLYCVTGAGWRRVDKLIREEIKFNKMAEFQALAQKQEELDNKQ